LRDLDLALAGGSVGTLRARCPVEIALFNAIHVDQDETAYTHTREALRDEASDTSKSNDSNAALH
jgi:hypothetical protein